MSAAGLHQTIAACSSEHELLSSFLRHRIDHRREFDPQLGSNRDFVLRVLLKVLEVGHRFVERLRQIAERPRVERDIGFMVGNRVAQ